jgi:hypothetical protein
MASVRLGTSKSGQGWKGQTRVAEVMAPGVQVGGEDVKTEG